MNLLRDLLVNEGESLEDFEMEAKREADLKLRRLAEKIAGSIEIQTRVFVGEPYAEVTHDVQREGYDLVLAGTRGLAPWEQFLVGSTKRLADFPELGRVVPEFGNVLIREIIVRSYRVVYRINHARKRVEAVRFWHSARGNPNLFTG